MKQNSKVADVPWPEEFYGFKMEPEYKDMMFYTILTRVIAHQIVYGEFITEGKLVARVVPKGELDEIFYATLAELVLKGFIQNHEPRPGALGRPTRRFEATKR